MAGRPKLHKSKKRIKRVEAAYTPPEYDQYIQKAAKLEGKTPGVWLRDLGLETARRILRRKK